MKFKVAASDDDAQPLKNHANKKLKNKLLLFAFTCIFLNSDYFISDEAARFFTRFLSATLVKSITKESCDYFFAVFCKKDSDNVVSDAECETHSDLKPSDRLVSRL